MEKIGQPDDEVSELYFTDTIDPTILNGHDNFSNVIIAQLYNAVENKLASPSIDTSKKNDFYISLKKLAESLGKKTDFSDHTGIDKILKYRSGIQVESFFHAYVENCIELLGCKAIVIRIDDVDMALGRAFEVLDEVRRLLSCPYIIPIVSGDHELYSHMVRVHFEGSATNKSSISDESVKSGHKLGKSLSESYLTKVFPNHLRLPLLAIERLLPHLLIKEKKETSDSISFATYERKLTNVFFYLCNGEERSTEYPKPKSAREVTQLIKALPPSKLVESKDQNLWDIFKSWAEQKHHGSTYTNAQSINQLADYASNDTVFRFDQLLAFNPILQAKENVSWADKDFLLEQKYAINDIIPPSLRRKGVSFEDNTNIIQSVFNTEMKVMRSMPPLELYSSNMTLTVSTVEEQHNDLLLAVYTHRDYYGKQGNRKYSIFFSRAFEILATSILSISNNVKVNNWGVQLKEIMERVPFYSVHAMNPTKYLEQEGEEHSLLQSTDSQDEINNNYDYSSLTSKIMEWEKTNRPKLSGLKSYSLLPIIHSVFNKVFTQLHILRTEVSTSKNYPEEHLTDIARRFEYIVINAFASFLKDDHAIQANVAIGAQVSTLRDHKIFMSVDRTLSRNIKGIIDDSTKEGDEDSTSKSKVLISILLEIIWDHPIFSDLNYSKEKMELPKYPFTSPASQILINQNKTPVYKNKAPKLDSLDKLQKRLGFSNAKRIKSWASKNSEDAIVEYNNAKKEMEDGSVTLRPNSAHSRMFNVLNEFSNDLKNNQKTDDNINHSVDAVDAVDAVDEVDISDNISLDVSKPFGEK
ncbi:hypothetical protein CWO07_06770 [Vibrio splendidus]|uniref:Uncharacterized protein n=1 Tax=Vibrio splendidus TaxID=29497 RepID=A0A2T5EYH2_VIBSP|nr:antiviral RADAR system adenosine triphosphatase RdrA [Vibrio splendidus]PTP38198.1 hypothetical protein CWO07_06770 [Vibrio splendidus]